MELTGYARFALPVQARACHELVRAAGAGRAIETLPCHGCSTTAEARLRALFALQSGADYDGRGPLIPIVLTQHFVIWRRAPYPAA